MIDAAALARLEVALVARHGGEQQERIRRGLAQVAVRWWAEDGSAEELAAFAGEQLLVEPASLEETARRLEYALEMLDGHATEAARELARFQSLDEGPSRPVDGLLASFSPAAHVDDDLFRSKVAFAVLLNWPLATLQQRLEQGPGWSREQWAQARLAGRFEHRLPAAVQQEIDRAQAAAERYIDGYNVHMDRLVDARGRTLFPAGLRLVSHWGLRDEIRAQYGQAGGLERQRLIAAVMARIVRQEIPAAVIDSSELQWDVAANRVRPAAGAGAGGGGAGVGGAAGSGGGWQEAAGEDDQRYRRLLDYFRAQRGADRYFPDLPTHIERAYTLQREMPEQRVRTLLESVLLSPTARKVGERVGKRLGRKLEPFDLWYTGFRPKSTLDEQALDRLTRQRYPTVARFQEDLPRLLGQLGFAGERAAFFAERIVVDPARGPGHAYGARLRDGKARLRTRFGSQGMDYKGFNIAIHELGHNVEQVISGTLVDHTLLAGVPNNGFTEAFAFLFQARDLQLLGQQQPADLQSEALRVLARFWDAFEISGVAILDTEIWHWLYAHPEATPAELRQATVELALGLWNRYYAPVFGVKDVLLPAIYSHIVCFGLYTPDYPLGMLITFQLEQYLKGRRLGEEMERMCRLGRLAPDVWMRQAVGSPVDSAPLLAAAEEALRVLGAAGR
ncbi:MAG: hypothetical protein FJ125_05135 [Deltaproteobacteria bacterium]|nr:hypothetical protein [Deltaproteobacteria bacterium]